MLRPSPNHGTQRLPNDDDDDDDDDETSHSLANTAQIFSKLITYNHSLPKHVWLKLKKTFEES